MTSGEFNRVSLKDVIAPSFFEVHKAVKSGLYDSFLLKGGRGSTKSSFVAIEIILGIVSDPEANAMVFRKVGDTVKDSVLQTLLWAIDILGMGAFFSHTKSPAVIVYKKTGQKIVMRGLDDAVKIKSIKVRKGYFKYLWFEELPEFDGPEEIRNVEQSVLRGGEKFIEFLTYNPPNDPAAWVNAEADKNTDPRRYVHHSTYLTVPPHWLGPKFIADAKRLEISDPLKYEHEYMGKAVGRAEQIVFHGKWSVMEFETPPLEAMYQNRLFFGGDWGFANDPLAILRFFIMVQNGNKNLYIEYEAGGVGVELDDIITVYRTVPESKKWKIYADCSRPETISHVRKKGYNIEGAPKWDGSVEDGVEYIRGFNHIYIHPRCVRTKEEFIKYSYKVDRHTQEVLPVILDKWNHWIDSLRYGLADYIQGNVSILDVV